MSPGVLAGRSAPSAGTPRILVITGTALTVLSTVAFFRVALLPSMGHSLGMSVSALGAWTALFALGRLVTDMPAGRLADGRNPAMVLSVAGVAVALASLTLAVAPGPSMAYVAAVVLGIGSSLANTNAMTVFSRVSASRRGRSMAVYSACLLGGQALGPATAGAIATLGSWRTAEVVASILAITTAAVLVMLRSHAQAGSGRSPLALASTVDTGGGRPRSPRRIALYLVGFATFFTIGAMPQTLVPIIGASVHELTPLMIGLVLGLGGLCRMVGAFAAGFVADTYGRRFALIPGLVLVAVGVAMLSVPWTWAWVGGVAVMSIGTVGSSVSATMLADSSDSGTLGRRLGRYRFVNDLGLIGGPIVVGNTFTHFGIEPATLSVSLALVALTVLVLFRVPETRVAS